MIKLSYILINVQTENCPIFVAGAMGPRGDGYIVETSKMSPDKAESYHTPQVKLLAEEEVDLINICVLTYPEEAIGFMRAAHKAGQRATVGFTLDETGCLPSGETLREAIEKVDAATESTDPLSRPLYYAINCVHPAKILRLFKNSAYTVHLVIFILKSYRNIVKVVEIALG